MITKINNDYCIVDENKNIIEILPYKSVDVFGPNVAVCIKEDKSYSYYRLIDLQGNILFDWTNSEMRSEGLSSFFNNGLEPVQNNENKWGFINLYGKVEIPFQFEYARCFYNGLAVVKLNSKFGFINKKGEIAVNIEFDYIEEITEGFHRVKKNELHWFIDEHGELLNREGFYYARYFLGGFAEVQKDENHIGILNKKGKLIFEFKRESMHDTVYGGQNGKYVTFSINDKLGLINSDGKILFEPSYNISIQHFRNDIFILGKKRNYKLVNHLSEQVFPGDYNYIEKLKNNTLRLRIRDHSKFKDTFGLIDENLEYIVPIIYQNLDLFDNNTYKVRKDNRVGLLNEKGEIIFHCQFDDIGYYIDGFAKIKIANSWGVVNTIGRIIIPFICDSISVPENSEIRATIEKKTEIFKI